MKKGVETSNKKRFGSRNTTDCQTDSFQSTKIVHSSSIMSNEDCDGLLAEQLEGLRVTNALHDKECVLVCDAGYGFPTESRPRLEKIRAIAKQLVNFLQWRQDALCHNNNNNNNNDCRRVGSASVQLVGCHPLVQDQIQKRMKELWSINNNENDNLPSDFVVSSDQVSTLLNRHYNDKNENDNDDDVVVYLSPDAPHELDPTRKPPKVVVVGMLIDRQRVRVNQSLQRARSLGIRAARWPLLSSHFSNNIHPSEPLNVDTILEAMQQWWWNHYNNDNNDDKDTTTTNKEDDARAKNKEAFLCATEQALQHHFSRHPNRPLHKSAPG